MANVLGVICRGFRHAKRGGFYSVIICREKGDTIGGENHQSISIGDKKAMTYDTIEERNPDYKRFWRRLL